ncbi:hypothetical protein IEN85_15570 [Pelagicoccus sp. NFK12]|uniref:Uncharacterized protein n=1 Tax=Pelagicoccus enzymogenes TaxID=2773457 RepID=A0A927FCI8_9BACT|nr:hypothetical protein [Pelagicoccus enzymogenes]MBD5780918.1 hypothetical protein [Pelagicoccus enzymogenes]
MNDEQAWKQFERLAAPDLSERERAELEAEIEKNPKLAKRLQAFRAMNAWAQMEPPVAEVEARERLFSELDRDRESQMVEAGLGKLFPVFMGGAVAAVLVLGALNVWQFDALSGDLWEALFGLPSETIETAIVSQL